MGPLENSNFTKGVIIGPYLPGVQSFYWIPGQKLYKTSTPIPPTGSTIGSGRDVLMFLASYHADYYNWFIGKNEREVKNARIGGLLFQGKVAKGANVLKLPHLEPSTSYYWRVDTHWGGYRYTGNIWNFHTV